MTEPPMSPAMIKRAMGWLARQELWLVLAATPLLMFPNRYTPLALLSILIVWLCRWAARRALSPSPSPNSGRGEFCTRMDIPILLLLVALPLSLYASVDLSRSLLKAYGIILGIALFYALVNHQWSEKGLWLAMNTFWVGGLGVCLLSWLGMAVPWQKLLPLPQIYERFPRTLVLPGLLVGQGYHPNEVGGALSMLIPPTLALLLWSPRPSGRWRRPLYRLWLLFPLSVMMALLFVTQSRTAFVALALGLALMGALRGRRALVLLPVLIILASLAASRLQVSGEFFATYMTTRWSLWRQSLLLIAQYPVTGIGLNTYHLISQLNYPYFLLTPFDSVFQGITIADMMNVHAHNIFLHAWVDLGILGIIGFTGLLVAFVATAWPVLRCGDGRLRSYAVGLAGGLAAYLAFGLTDTIALGAKPAILIWAFMGLMAVLEREAREGLTGGAPSQAAPLPPLSGGERGGVRGFLAAALGALLLLLVAFSFSSSVINLGSIALHKALLEPGLTAGQRAGYLDRAEGLSRWATHLWPRRSLAYRNLGRIYQARGQHSAATDAFAQALRMAPGDVFTHFELGQTYQVMGKPDEALAEWVKAGADIYFLDRGDAYAREGAWEEALREYLIAAQIAPDSSEVFNSLISACNQLQSWDQALDVYEAAVTLDPTAPYPHYYLARLWWSGKRNQVKAVQELQRAIELQPKEGEFHAYLGDIYQDVGELEEAITQYSLALQLNPKDGRSRQKLENLRGQE